MSFWTNCNRCGSSVYMAKVQPPNEYYSRWLPFEDESLIDCHFEYCSPTRRTTLPSNKNPSKSIKKIILVKCPICKVDVRKDRLEKHKLKVHS